MSTVHTPKAGQIHFRPGVPADLPSVRQLLVAQSLPNDGVVEWVERFWIAEEDGILAGVAGLEDYGDVGLLRSVAVAPSHQSHGVGAALVDAVLEDAGNRGVREVYLLTTTADRYFRKLGFVATSRSSAPATLLASVEFRGACPESAVLMHRTIPGAMTET
jgi:N-acetylglutamate synthase-like GNAT family acetyltransferase